MTKVTAAPAKSDSVRKGDFMADFEERQLKISFDELNTKLNNCIQKILSASFMESKDSLNDFEICL